MSNKLARTKGDVIVQNIKVGDIHYEFEYGTGIKCEVITKPIQNEEGNWVWFSKNVYSGAKISYLVNPDHPHYSPNLYTYEAYKVKYYLGKENEEG
jgi:hypothetical protein